MPYMLLYDIYLYLCIGKGRVSCKLNYTQNKSGSKMCFICGIHERYQGSKS